MCFVVENNKYLLRDIITTYNQLLFLEEDYKTLGADRLLIRQAILRKLKELTIQLESLNENVSDKVNFWSYHAIGDKKCINIEDNEMFLKVLLNVANNISNKYSIKRVMVSELLPNDNNCSLVNIRWVDILSDKDSLAIFSESEPIYHPQLIKRLNILSENNCSFVMLSNLIKEYDGEYLKEKIATSIGKDIIVSVVNRDTLDISLNKLVEYITRYGSDFSNLDVDKVTTYVNKIKSNNKKRVLNNYKYVKYNRK